jgi:mRNA interferase RelE/StbE
MTQEYNLEFTAQALKQFLALPKTVQVRIQSYINTYIHGAAHPRMQGKALAGQYKGGWRYRIGNYRLICKIDDDRLTVLAVKVGNRKDVYR